jgi:hypothetical protein
MQLTNSLLQSMGKLLGVKGQAKFPSLPTHEANNALTSTTTSSHSPQPTNPPTDLVYLLLCYSEGRYATKLLQLDLVTEQARCDKTLFKAMSSTYVAMRGKYLSFLSIRKLHGIKFVHFEFYNNTLVDIRKENDLPVATNNEYRYHPAPSDVIPPVGENHMMHLFKHPEDATDKPICLERFPKKLREKLASKNGISPGWGLQLVEGWDYWKVWLIVFVTFGIGGTVFAVLWSVLKQNIQDAFSVASFIVAMGMLTVGTTLALLELSR